MSAADPSPRQSGRIIISQQTLLPLGMVLALVGLMWSAKSYVDGQFASLSTQITSLVNRMDRADWRSRDPWTATDMRLWAERASRQNPNLNLPAVDTKSDDR